MIKDRFKIKRPIHNLNLVGGITASNLLKVFIALAVIFLVIKLVNKPSNTDTQDVTDVAKPKATTSIDREFTFPLKNKDREEVSRIKFYIGQAELRDEIIIKGKKATAIKGRDFLVLNLKITNDFNQSIEIDTRDYVRLSVNGNENERLAPDIHNDPVEVQAISTKLTRIGIPVDEKDSNLVLFVGEIKGDKERVEINF